MSKTWESGGNFENAPTGPHVARLISIIDLGTQTSTYEGKENVRRQNYLTWELPNELREDGKTFTVSKFYTASLGEKSNLYKDLTSWLGKPPTVPFDPKSLLGKGCQVVVVGNEDNGKVKVSAVVGLPKGTALPKEAPYPELFFSLDDFDEDAFSKVPAGIQKMIEKSPEYEAIINGETATAAKPDEDIPF